MGNVHYEQQFSCGKTLLRHLYYDGGSILAPVSCEGGRESEVRKCCIDFTTNGKVALYCITV